MIINIRMCSLEIHCDKMCLFVKDTVLIFWKRIHLWKVWRSFFNAKSETFTILGVNELCELTDSVLCESQISEK